MLTPDDHGVAIPTLCPLQCIFIDAWKEKVVHKPDVAFHIWVEAIIDLQVLEELLPLETKTCGNVTPEMFNSNIMNTSIATHQIHVQ